MRNRPDCSISLCICKPSLSRLHHSNRLTKASAISFSCLGKLAQAAVRTSGPIRDGASQVRRFFHDDAHRTLGSAASPTGARRPQPRPDAQSGAPRSPRIADGRCRAAFFGPHPFGGGGISPHFIRTRPSSDLLGDRNLAPTHSLAHLEALELRMVDVERLVRARILVGGAEFLRPCPGFECPPALPKGWRGKE